MSSKVNAALLTFVLIASTASADSPNARMNVSVQVMARAVVSVDSQPGDIVVTAADIARGYVDVTEPLRLRVRTNSLRGCLLQVSKTSETFAAVELSFGNVSMSVANQSWIARPHVAGGETVSATIRVRLAAGAEAGRHPLPVEVSAVAL